MSFFFFLRLLIASLYVLLIKYIIRNWFSQEEYLLTQFKPGCYHKGITVLIPARNEEQNIGARHH